MTYSNEDLSCSVSSIKLKGYHIRGAFKNSALKYGSLQFDQ